MEHEMSLEYGMLLAKTAESMFTKRICLKSLQLFLATLDKILFFY